MSLSAPICTPEALEEQLRKHVMSARMIGSIQEHFSQIDTTHSDFPLLAMEILISREPEHFAKAIEDWSHIKTTTNEVSTGDMIDEIGALKGFYELESGVSVIGMELGQVEHHPVYAVMYHDGQEFRGYIPREGNVYNRETKAAFGLNPLRDSAIYLRDHGEAKRIPDRTIAAQRLNEGRFYPLCFSQTGILKDLNNCIKPDQSQAA